MPIDDDGSRPAALLRLPGYALAHLGKLTRAALRQAFADHGLSSSAYFVLMCLEEHDGLSQRELADLLSMDRSDLVRVIDDLEASGQVRRTPDPGDRRRHRLLITTAGSQASRRGTHLVDEATDELLSGLTPRDRATLHRLVLLALNTRRSGP
jgi:DNA-binding MarR family transcriptional regulator